MTTTRVLMAAALLVLGFMIWGVHTSLSGLTNETHGLRADLAGVREGLIPRTVERTVVTPAPPAERVYVPLPASRPPPCICQKHKSGAVHKKKKSPPPVEVVSPSQQNEIDRLLERAHHPVHPRGPPPPQHSSQR